MTKSNDKEKFHFLKKSDLKLLAWVFTIGFAGSLTAFNVYIPIVVGLLAALVWIAVWRRKD